MTLGLAAALALAAALGPAAPALAQAGPAPEPIVIPGVPSPSDPATPQGEIDSLLKLPSGYFEPSGRTVAGAGESEWRRRFERAQATLDRAVRDLEATKQELDEVAGSGGSSQWSVAPPGVGSGEGGGPTNSPLSFKLRQELLRRREALDAAERGLKELRIEADLAGVPIAWRGDENRPIQRRIPEDPR